MPDELVEEIQRTSRDRKLREKLNRKGFVDFREISLTIPTKPATGFTFHQLKRIENQIVNFLTVNNTFSVSNGRLGNYIGFLTGKYPELFDERYHGFVSKQIFKSINYKTNYLIF